MSELPAHGTAASPSRAVLLLGTILPIVASACGVGGAILLATPAPAASFGWFAYVPLSSESFMPAGRFFTPLQFLGLGVLVFALVGVTLSLGWRLGRRSNRH